MLHLNAKGRGSRGTAQGQESNASSDRQHNFIDPVCKRPVLQSELADTQQHRAVILESLAPFVGQEVLHA
jgi:hypothetical protein